MLRPSVRLWSLPHPSGPHHSYLERLETTHVKCLPSRGAQCAHYYVTTPQFQVFCFSQSCLLATQSFVQVEAGTTHVCGYDGSRIFFDDLGSWMAEVILYSSCTDNIHSFHTEEGWIIQKIFDTVMSRVHSYIVLFSSDNINGINRWPGDQRTLKVT